KLFLKHKLHAKLYLLYNSKSYNTPIVGYMGSSNLTLAGLSGQGELNIDVVEEDACRKLEKWFNERWDDRWCLDISEELANIIDESWAREQLIPPYYIPRDTQRGEVVRIGREKWSRNWRRTPRKCL